MSAYSLNKKLDKLRIASDKLREVRYDAKEVLTDPEKELLTIMANNIMSLKATATKRVEELVFENEAVSVKGNKNPKLK